ncbi:rod shape-determining protein MreD [Beduinella massiliensis]|uniref:rod shape-determining protein MreD n=1 Tax=Beduinella massiliensis TaxID=1852363 RepID=UPI000C82A7D0
MSKFLRMTAVVYLSYIIQTSVFRYLAIANVQPDILACALAALVFYGGTYEGFCAGAAFGLLMDTAVGQVAGLYMILYPLMGYVAARMRMGFEPMLVEKAAPKRRAGRKLLLSIVICMAITLMRESVFMIYTYLNGVDLTMRHAGRVLLCTVYSGVVCVLIIKMTNAVMHYQRPRFRKGKEADTDV